MLQVSGNVDNLVYAFDLYKLSNKVNLCSEITLPILEWLNNKHFLPLYIWKGQTLMTTPVLCTRWRAEVMFIF
jgi:hypothetical protein